jgi:hypothetical protein
MILDLQHPTLALETGEVVTLDDAAGRTICARSGRVWITEEGTPHDHIVESGGCRVVERAGRTLVQAMAPSLVAIQ